MKSLVDYIAEAKGRPRWFQNAHNELDSLIMVHNNEASFNVGIGTEHDVERGFRIYITTAKDQHYKEYGIAGADPDKWYTEKEMKKFVDSLKKNVDWTQDKNLPAWK